MYFNSVRKKFCSNSFKILVECCFECYAGSGCRFKKYFTNYQCTNSVNVFNKSRT